MYRVMIHETDNLQEANIVYPVKPVILYAESTMLVFSTAQLCLCIRAQIQMYIACHKFIKTLCLNWRTV